MNEGYGRITLTENKAFVLLLAGNSNESCAKTNRAEALTKSIHHRGAGCGARPHG
jgi:hypothetical protein